MDADVTDLKTPGLQAGFGNAIDIVSALVKTPVESATDSASIALKRALAGRYKEALVEPLQLLIKKGRVKKEKVEATETFARLHNILEYIDGKALEQEKFEAIRNLFLNGLLEDENPLHHVMIRTLTNMTLEEILVLNALGHEDAVTFAGTKHQPQWLDVVCEASKLLYAPLVLDIAGSLKGKLLAREDSSCFILTPYGTGLRDMMSTKWDSESHASPDITNTPS